MRTRKGSTSISLLLEKDEQVYLDSRITDVEKAASRGRWVYGAASILSMMLISVAYNEFFSWSRFMASGLEGTADRVWENQLQLMLMREWVASLQFDVPYVGGKFGASDAGIVGGFVLLLASFWCYYAASRENFLVFYLIKDAEEFKFSDNAKFYLRNQIISTQLFSESSSKVFDSDALKRYATISSEESPESSKDQEKEKKSLSDVESESRRTHRLRSLMMHLIFLMPGLSLVFVFLTDILTLMHPSPFRAVDQQILYTILCGDNFIWSCTTYQLPLRIIVSMAFMGLVWSMMIFALRFQKGTDRLVQFALDHWRQPLSDLQREAKNG